MGRQGHLEFNHVYVVQSLFPEDKRTGSTLYKSTIAAFAADLQIGAELVDVSSVAELFAFLDRVLAEVVSEGRYPILHVEIHGTKDGFVLGSGEFVPWASLLDPLTRINRATRNNLLLTLAVCHGGYLATILNASRAAPFWAVLGPDKREWDGVLLDVFATFYSTFLKDLDGPKALDALRQKAKASVADANFLFINAERMFASVFRRYVTESCNPTAIKMRITSIMKRLKVLHPDVTEATWAAYAATTEAKMRDPRDAFDTYRRRYFMIDEFPENDERFGMTYDELMALPKIT